MSRTVLKSDRTSRRALFACLILAIPSVLAIWSPATVSAASLMGLGTPTDPKVEVHWNRFSDTDGLHRILRELHQAYPQLAELVELGKSYEGRSILALEVTNEATGPAREKPAMYIDGNIHGNEVQAGDVVAYTAWMLLESYGKVDRITKLLDEKAFYLVPTINPDGRDHWFENPANPHLFRGGVVPVDNDGDGRFDEDGPDDMDGDGHITSMRIKDEWGRHEPDPDFPDFLLREVDRDEKGSYRQLGWEGFDNDGDGQINEDGPGGYDPNRNWPWGWQPESVQYGAHDYPFSLPNTRAVSNYVAARPNIAAVQTYHNAGGMILRGPGQEGGILASEDDAVLRFIAERGEEMLPHYESLVVWDDLYTVWGGEFDWFYGGLGILSFTNEMWDRDNYFRRSAASGADGQRESQTFRDLVLMGEGWTPWTEFDHPQYGRVEIGGTPKNFGRVPPGFLLEEELHRNTVFTLYHAECMPRVRIAGVETENLGGGLRRLWVTVENEGVIPSRSAHDVSNQITPRNAVVVEGVEVIRAGRLPDPQRRDQVVWQEARPSRLLLESIPGLGRVDAVFLVAGGGNARVRVESSKGGTDSQAVRLP